VKTSLGALLDSTGMGRVFNQAAALCSLSLAGCLCMKTAILRSGPSVRRLIQFSLRTPLNAPPRAGDEKDPTTAN
jgi:hypothetical protein